MPNCADVLLRIYTQSLTHVSVALQMSTKVTRPLTLITYELQAFHILHSRSEWNFVTDKWV